jgi:hypothetical protein
VTPVSSIRCEFPQPALATAIGVGHQHTDAHTALHGGAERFLDLFAIDPEDREVDRATRALDRLHDRRQACLRLDG